MKKRVYTESMHIFLPLGTSMILSGFFVGGLMGSVAIGFASGFASGVMTGIVYMKQAPVNSRTRTLLDITNVQDAERLVRLFGGYHYGGDEIADSLYGVYSAFPPDEHTMRRLSLLYQEYMGTGGVEEYAVTLLYGVTTDVLNNTIPTGRTSIPRSVSVASNVDKNVLQFRTKSCLSLPKLQH